MENTNNLTFLRVDVPRDTALRLQACAGMIGMTVGALLRSFNPEKLCTEELVNEILTSWFQLMRWARE